MKWWIGGCVAAALLSGGCHGGEPKKADTPGPSTATATAEARAATSPTPHSEGPLRKAYARGETVDIERGTLFLDPKTGGGEAWADVGASPSGMFVAWNGPDGKQPPVLYRTDTYQKVELETGGQPGTVLGYGPDDSEAAVRAGNELVICSTSTGAARLRFALDPAAAFVRAYWGPGGRVAVTQSSQSQRSLGLLAWNGGEMRTLAEVPDNWAAWSPDGRTIAVSGVGGAPDGWLALIEMASGGVRRIDEELYNPRWSESGQYVAGQLASGELLVYHAGGRLHMRMNGVCAYVGTPWSGEEIVTRGFGQDVAVAMDGTYRAYPPPPHPGPVTTFGPGNSVVLLDRIGGTTLAELQVADNIMVSGYLGEPWVTSDGRGKATARRWREGRLRECRSLQRGDGPVGGPVRAGNASRSTVTGCPPREPNGAAAAHAARALEAGLRPEPSARRFD